MKIQQYVCAMATLFLASLWTPAFAASMAELDGAMGVDGLQKITVKGIEMAYARPGATLAGYDKIKLEPVEVAFGKNWNPTRPGSMLKISAQERENIRAGVAKIIHDEFVKALQAKSSYEVVEGAGPNVLRVKASIVNL
jgi:hypothetical protein